MRPQVMAQENARPGAPHGWDAVADGPCGALSVEMTRDSNLNVKHCESAWRPSVAELELLNKGGVVILRVACWQVPVTLYVDGPERVKA